jgi:hypothetical protein
MRKTFAAMALGAAALIAAPGIAGAQSVYEAQSSYEAAGRYTVPAPLAGAPSYAAPEVRYGPNGPVLTRIIQRNPTRRVVVTPELVIVGTAPQAFEETEIVTGSIAPAPPRPGYAPIGDRGSAQHPEARS